MSAEKSGRRLRGLLGLLLLVVVAGTLWGPKLRREILARAVLGSQLPSESAIEELVQSYPDPLPFLQRLWNTGKLAHRQLAMETLRHQRPAPSALRDKRLEALLLAGTEDPDTSIRELALGGLAESKSPLLLEAAQNQLRNSDPQIRLLGVKYLSRLEARTGLPMLIPLLKDSDLRVAATVDAALRRWTGIDFGVRIAQAIPKQHNDGRESLDPADVQLIRSGLAQREAWWRQHAGEFNPPAAPSPTAVEPTQALPVADFALPDIAGHTVKLSSFRGKMVILNFWATWCTACLPEISDLMELQKRHRDQLVVLGISLDGVPDDHGHVLGLDDKTEAHDGPDHQGRAHPATIDNVRAKVARVAQARSIAYPILLDPSNLVGARFNGGELPTNVLIDPQGHLRRRFIGARSLDVWEAILAEVGHLPHNGQ
jgi:thiol-disulfide isomerase/thioredoxin